MKIYIEYESIKLKDMSTLLYEKFKNSNYDVILLDNNIPISQKLNTIKNNKDSFTISGKLNNNDSIEIIYPLRENNVLAKELATNLENFNVSKYYQLRDNTDTSKDYYEILRDINNNSVLIKYGSNFLNNPTIANIIYQTVNSFLNQKNTYTVQSGDSLYSIAKRFNTTVDDIKKANNLSSNILSIGQKIIIPNDNQNNNDNDNNQNTYTVQSGDSLYSIARRFNTTVDDIKNVNNLSSNILSIGQKITIPNNNQNNNDNDNDNDNNQNTYTVQSGDSLYSIARRFNTTVDNIKNINNLTSNLLSIGQKITIPENNPNNNTSLNTYTVQSGDSLYSIARRFNTTVDNIKNINNLTSNLLSIGQKLIIK